MMRSHKGLLFLLVFYSFFYSNAQQKEFKLNDIFSNRAFYGSSLSGVQWFDGGNRFTFVKLNPAAGSYDIYEHNVKTGEEKIFLSGSELKEKISEENFSARNYLWSPNGKYILFSESLPARGFKSRGSFNIYELASKKFYTIPEDNSEQLNAQFSPDGVKLAFIRNNNIFVFDLEQNKELQITFDGSAEILNGHFDWVYEEEFSIINGIEWSSDSKTIAFWRLDQSKVPEIQIAKWDSLYFNFYKMHYPKAGGTNSSVKIGIADIQSAKTVWADLGEETDIYVPRIRFTADPKILSVQRLNRLQNKNELIFADINSGKGKTVLTETDDAWVDVKGDLFFLKGKNQFIWSSERDGFNHLYLFDYEGKLINQITKGKWEVDKLIGVDETADKIYYTSNERGVIYKDLYSIDTNGENKAMISKDAGTHSINLSPNNQYYIDSYSSADKLPATVLFDTNGKVLAELIKSNMSAFDGYQLSQMEFIKFTTNDGIELNASIIKPKDFDPGKKYPVLIDNYSGPGSQTVVDRWDGFNYLWYQVLAQNGYIIFMLDNRGTGGRGRDFTRIVYKNLGHWEVNDMIEGAKYLSSLSYVDSNRIGIWGWSYGGYISALTLMKAADYFKAAISVAPVTHWKYYDTIYAERYMQTPELNPAGYKNSSVLEYADNLKGKLLLIHGTADDNVHFQNSVVLVSKLIEKNKQFSTMYYPEKAHGIYGGLTRQHLYKIMTEFILNNL